MPTQLPLFDEAVAQRIMTIFTDAAREFVAQQLHVKRAQAEAAWQAVSEARRRQITMAWAEMQTELFHARRKMLVEAIDGEELSIQIRRASSYLADHLPGAIGEWGQPMFDTLLQNTGTQYYSLDELARLGHPYGHPTADKPWRVPGNLGLPDALANYQSGELHGGFRIGVTRVGNTAYVRITNNSEHSKYFTGEPTTLMRGRRLMQHAYEQARPDMENAMRRMIYAVKRDAAREATSA